MFQLVSRLIFLIMVNCYLSEAADSFLTLGAKKNLSQLNGAHLKFAVAHVNMITISLKTLSPMLIKEYSRLLVPQVPPINVLTMGPDGNYTHSGTSALLIDWLSAKLNFT